MKFLILLLFLILLTINNSFGQGVGTQAPDFSHATLDHGQITLSDHIGKVVYLFFFGWG